MKLLAFILLVSLGWTGCKKESVTTNTTTDFTLQSTEFANNGTLPKDYTCDGSSASPPLKWINAPAGTSSFAVTMHHIPGSGEKHVYIVLYNIPSSVSSMAKSASGVGLFGINTVNGKTSYSPPCSQGPGAKLYVLTVYALSATPIFSVPQTAVTMDMLLASISKITLATSVLNVNYTRP